MSGFWNRKPTFFRKKRAIFVVFESIEYFFFYRDSKRIKLSRCRVTQCIQD